MLDGYGVMTTRQGGRRVRAPGPLPIALMAALLPGVALAQSDDGAGPGPGVDARAAVDRAAEHITAGRTTEAVEALREAALAVWSAAPFDIASIEMTVEAARRYRLYDVRPDARIPRGDAIHLYVEPVGMAYEFEDGAYSMRLEGDFLIEDTGGAILGGQKGFANVPYTFPVPATEVYMTVSLGTSSLPPGDYVINMTFRDPLGNAEANRKIPFTVIQAKD